MKLFGVTTYRTMTAAHWLLRPAACGERLARLPAGSRHLLPSFHANMAPKPSISANYQDPDEATGQTSLPRMSLNVPISAWKNQQLTRSRGTDKEDNQSRR